MVVTILSGAEGTGKTSQLLGVAKEFGPTAWGILELKDVEKIMGLESSTFQPQRLYQVYEDGTKLQGNVDPAKTLDTVRKWRDKIYSSNPLPQTIVIDGISELRDYVIEEWIKKDNLKRDKNKHRESIGEKNLSAWAEVNAEVKKIIEPLINKALLNHVNLFMTAGMKDKYMNGDVVGYTPDYKAWMSRSVQCLLQLSCEGEAYNLRCTKEPENPRWGIKDIVKGTGLLDALRAHNLVEQALVDWMISYTKDGEACRAFVKARTADVARKEFEEKCPDGVIKEITK